MGEPHGDGRDASEVGESAGAATGPATPKAEGWKPRGAKGRVAEAQRQARRGLTLAAAFAVAAPLSALVPHDTGSWLPLHLFLVGGVLGAIAAATQFLAVTWSASPPSPAPVAAFQRWCLAVGAGAVAVGREVDDEALITLGAAAVVLSLAALAGLLVHIRRSAVTDRYAPAIEAYLLAFVAGAGGAVLGTLVATGQVGDDYLALRGAHVTTNVYGLVGLVIAGTLPFFAATQVRMKMSPRARPTPVRVVIGVLAATVAISVGGHVADRPGVAAAGLVAHGIGLVGLVTLLPVVGRRQLDWAGARLVQLATGIAWWIGTTFVMAARVAEGTDDGPVLQALVIGGFAQILVASLAYFGPVLRGGGHQQLTAGFALTRSWVSVVAANVAAAAALAELRPLMGACLAIWLADSLWRAIALARLRPPT